MHFHTVLKRKKNERSFEIYYECVNTIYFKAKNCLCAFSVQSKRWKIYFLQFNQIKAKYHFILSTWIYPILYDWPDLSELGEHEAPSIYLPYSENSYIQRVP